ncbi:MAG: peroxidase [Actinobacteria bacterium]|nr:peroxidase [Actinomycetota bacterium]
MLVYAEKLTRTPWEVTEEDLEGMRDTGLADPDILAVNLVTSYFAYVNRIAEGLGVTLEGGDESIGW